MLESATHGTIKGALLQNDQAERNLVDLNQEIVLKSEDQTRKDYQFDSKGKAPAGKGLKEAQKRGPGKNHKGQEKLRSTNHNEDAAQTHQ